MKKLLFLFLAASLFAACNNDGPNPFIKKDRSAKTSDKDEKSDDISTDKKVREEKYSDKDDHYANDDNSIKDNTSNSWSTTDKNKWLDGCMDEIRGQVNAKQICSCVLEKAEAKYKDAEDADDATDAEIRKMLQDCRGAAGTDREDENTGTTRNADDDAFKTGNGNSESWTIPQRRRFLADCESSAHNNNKQGLSSQQITSYCDCMVKKVESKYNFQDASKMTAADFQTREWQNAAADCLLSR